MWYVGMDVHLKSSSVCVLDEHGHRVGVQISAQGEVGCSREVDAGRGRLTHHAIGMVLTWTHAPPGA